MKKILNPNYGISPAPVAMVSSGDYENSNIATISWTGILNSEPMIIYVSVRKSRLTHEIISKNKEFVVNLPDEKLVKQADFCGTKSGRDVNKIEMCNLKYTLKNGACIFEDAKITLVLKKLYADNLKEECFLDSNPLSNYKNGDFHRSYTCEIIDVIIK